MIDISIIENIIVVLINLIGIWLGFWVYKKDKKQKLNQWFAIMTFFVILWVDFAYLGHRVQEVFLSTIFYRLNFFAVALSLVSAYYFYVVYFLKQKTKNLILEKFILFFGIFFAISAIFSDFIVKTTIIHSWGAEIVFGFGNNLFNLYALFVGLIVVGYLIKRYFFISKKQKLKIQYFLVGTIIFAVFNIIFNIIVLFLSGTVFYQHFGDYSAIFLLGFTAYAIVRQELFGIKIVLIDLLVGAMCIVLAILPFSMPSDFLKVLTFSIFILFLMFSYYLVKTIHKEQERKDKLEKLTRKLKSVNKELKRLDRAKSEFISMASHQLRTPISAIRGYISLLLDRDYGEISKEQEKVLTNVFISATRTTKVVSNLLDLSRIGLRKVKLEKENINIQEVVKEIYTELNQIAKRKDIELVYNKSKQDIPNIYADRFKIRQVLFNIIDNAIKYTEKGIITTDVRIQNDKQSKIMIIKVKDTGLGFTQQDKEKIFELFVRGTAGRDNYIQGTGMGLHLAKKFVQMHNGRIHAYSEGEGKGSVFCVELPIIEKPKEEVKEIEEIEEIEDKEDNK